MTDMKLTCDRWNWKGGYSKFPLLQCHWDLHLYKYKGTAWNLFQMTKNIKSDLLNIVHFLGHKIAIDLFRCFRLSKVFWTLHLILPLESEKQFWFITYFAVCGECVYIMVPGCFNFTALCSVTVKFIWSPEGHLRSNKIFTLSNPSSTEKCEQILRCNWCFLGICSLPILTSFSTVCFVNLTRGGGCMNMCYQVMIISLS